jgi:hypothetical protein
MALQDLTPQLRTRLSRMERAVGWFVILAIALLTFGFGYYVYSTAESKGWFRTKAPFFCFIDSAAGLKPGDPVSLMGWDVGHIKSMETMAPFSGYNIYVEFEIQQPYIGYLWTEGSLAEAVPANLLGSRKLQVTKGTSGYPAYTFHTLRTVSAAEALHLPDVSRWALAQEILEPHSTNRLATPRDWLTNAFAAIQAAGLTNVEIMVRDPKDVHKLMTGIWNEKTHRFDRYDPDAAKPFFLPSRETPAVQDQVQALVAQVQHALPGIFNLTNQLSAMLANSTILTSNLNAVALDARPAVSNLAAVTAHLDRPGALGEWLLPTNLNHQLEGTVSNANAAVVSANTNLNLLVVELSRSLDNLASITSNLNQQVEVNSNMLSAISSTVVHADEFVQGLKRHWLFRSAFKSKAPKTAPAPPPQPLQSPKEKGER